MKTKLLYTFLIACLCMMSCEREELISTEDTQSNLILDVKDGNDNEEDDDGQNGGSELMISFVNAVVYKADTYNQLNAEAFDYLDYVFSLNLPLQEETEVLLSNELTHNYTLALDNYARVIAQYNIFEYLAEPANLNAVSDLIIASRPDFCTPENFIRCEGEHFQFCETYIDPITGVTLVNRDCVDTITRACITILYC